MRLREFLRSDLVVPHLAARDVEGVLRELASRADAAALGSEEAITERLLQREREHSTVMGSGLAIPHATVEGLDQTVIGVALSRDPIQFGPVGFEPVHVFFVLLSPPGREREHVKLLARICRLMRQENLVERLHSAPDAAGVIEVIEAVDAEHV